MRAEKGFIMIGDETDGTVTPQDRPRLGGLEEEGRLHRQARTGAQRSSRPDRKQLVGLLTEDPAVVLPDGAHAVVGRSGQRGRRELGHVTSSYFSPTLGRSVAMALIAGGAGRMGEMLTSRSQAGSVRVLGRRSGLPRQGGPRQNA